MTATEGNHITELSDCYREIDRLRSLETALRASLAAQRERTESAERALDNIMREYRTHNVAGIDVMFQIAKDARGKEPDDPDQGAGE